MNNFIIQSILIPTNKYSVEDAGKWVINHGYNATKIHTTPNYYRIRQHTPNYAIKNQCTNVKTIHIGTDGIQFIVYYDPLCGSSNKVAYCDDLHGAGIYDTAKTIIFGRTDYPADQKKLLEKYGSNSITNISVGRTPLPQILTNALNILTLGAFQQILNKSPYDKLYHLFSIITLDNGVKLKIDKTQAINMKPVGNYNPKHTEYITISNIPSGLTFKTALDNTKKSLGSKFFTYDAIKNNCQLFIKTILSSNNLLTKHSQDFIEQDVREMFKSFQILQKVVHGITAVGTALDIVKKGGYLYDEDYDDDDDELLGGIRAPFSRYGGKSRIAEQLISMFPNPDKYDVYVEPFLGSGNVFLRKDPYNHKEVINDLDKQVHSVFKKLQSDSKYINDNIKRHTVTKSEWLKLHESNDPADIITSIKWSFMGRNTHFSESNSKIKTDYLPYQDRLKSVVILNTSYEHVIQKYDSPRTFFYLDPPYNTKSANTDYMTDSITPLDIYNSVKNVKGFMMISYNNDAEMKRLFKDWNIRYINTKYTNNFILKNKKDKSHKIVKELVITNY